MVVGRFFPFNLMFKQIDCVKLDYSQTCISAFFYPKPQIEIPHDASGKIFPLNFISNLEYLKEFPRI